MNEITLMTPVIRAKISQTISLYDKVIHCKIEMYKSLRCLFNILSF